MQIDELIGQNVIRLRGSMSQKDLAEAMRERGWKWSQATVWAVEKGDRPLRLGEARDLANLFKKSVIALTSTNPEHRVEEANDKARDAQNSLKEALGRFQSSRLQLAEILDSAQARGTDLEGAGRTAEMFVRTKPEQILREWRIYWASEQLAMKTVNDARLVEAGKDPANPPWTRGTGPLMTALSEEATNGELQERSTDDNR